jgi:hypothetical protein
MSMGGKPFSNAIELLQTVDVKADTRQAVEFYCIMKGRFEESLI